MQIRIYHHHYIFSNSGKQTRAKNPSKSWICLSFILHYSGGTSQAIRWRQGVGVTQAQSQDRVSSISRSCII